MQFKKALNLLCILSSSVALLVSQPCARNVKALHHAADVSNVRNTCLCPTYDHGYRVSDFLNKQNTNLRRVVVFYYKDKTNNDVHMYTPGDEKQSLIPELEYDSSDDLHKVDNQVSLKLFDDNPANKALDSQSFYPYPNRRYQHQLHQHANPRLTYISNVGSYSSWYPDNWYDPIRPDVQKNNNEVQFYSPQIFPYKVSNKAKISTSNKKKIDPENNEYVFDNKVEYTQAPEHNSYSFNNWYSQHAVQFPEVYSGDPQYISFNDLKEQILHLFSGHGYSVINNQVLDPQGEVVEASNYKLIRVKIKEDEDQRRLSDEVEGIMLINLYPLNILGIVPLKKSFDEINQSAAVNKQLSDEYRLDSKDNIDEISNLDDKVNVIGEANATQIVAKNENVTTGIPPEMRKTKRPKNLDFLLNNLARAVSHLVLPNRRESEQTISPGFRIIGGNAATGSGAPISSRGRSATPY